MNLPIYQHPTMTVLVDDSTSFLNSLRFHLGAALPSMTFGTPTTALNWLREQCRWTPPPNSFLSPSVDTYTLSPQPFNVALHVEQVCRISARSHRFMTPSVVVVDYSMPQMNGIEFCAAARDLPCKKILLTGVADESVAVEAFNRGLIDRYIRKSDPDVLDRLEAELKALQREYFLTQSGALRNLLTLHEYAFVGDPAISALVREVGASYQIVEHYLFKSPSGFLMIDGEGRSHLLVIETEASMEAHFEVACDSGAPPSLLNALSERRVIPNFYNGDGMDGMYSPDCGEDWYRHTTPAQVCHGRELYYWGLFDLESDSLPAPIESYSAFLRRHQAA